MAKMNKTISFKNAEFRVTKDELTGEKRIVIIEETKDDTIYTEFDDVLEMFAMESGLSFKLWKPFNLAGTRGNFQGN